MFMLSHHSAVSQVTWIRHCTLQ